jgi:nitric oxide reductase large subunit
MKPEQNQKTIAYVILGIVVVIALGIYIYMGLSAAPAAPEVPVATGPVSPQQVILTPEEAAAKAQLLASMSGMSIETLTRQQASAKAAVLSEEQSRGK